VQQCQIKTGLQGCQKTRRRVRVRLGLGLGQVRNGMCFCHTTNPEQQWAQPILLLINGYDLSITKLNGLSPNFLF
jgi:hypothetical protein